ncbi:MAG TPA: hypothetical protein VFE00_13995, partial [Arthrobacter sp.]|nr:hypothetical protein [Arthrobacter sp.]
MPATGSGSPCLDFEPAVLAGSPHSDTVLATTHGGIRRDKLDPEGPDRRRGAGDSRREGRRRKALDLG